MIVDEKECVVDVLHAPGEFYPLASDAARRYQRVGEFAFQSLTGTIRKAEEFYGVTRTREIYERAVEVLPDHQVKDICLRFAEMERQLGEIDRARAVFVHASQFCDPRRRLFADTFRALSTPGRAPSDATTPSKHSEVRVTSPASLPASLT